MFNTACEVVCQGMCVVEINGKNKLLKEML